jgi:hypothetical protein
MVPSANHYYRTEREGRENGLNRWQGWVSAALRRGRPGPKSPQDSGKPSKLSKPNYYFIFDKFFIDEVVALQDFVSAFPVKLQFFAKTKGPMQVFGRLTRTELVLS